MSKQPSDSVKTVLTGVKPTGVPHLGNYLGAIRPALDSAQASGSGFQTFLFIADYHSLTSVHDPKVFRQQTYEVAATWLACGLDPQKMTLYRQSDIPEIFQIAWVLGCFTSKGMMNRAHAYKAAVQANREKGEEDLDANIDMGLYTYPVLMASDIISFDTDLVPVGKDQIQHVEFARDMAQRFNNNYGKVLKIPSHLVNEATGIIPGLDGQKMSKSYGNHIPIFAPENQLRKLVNRIKTDSSQPGEPKDPETSPIFQIYKHFASTTEVAEMRAKYAAGISWGDAKALTFEAINRVVSPMRETFDSLMADTEKLEKILLEGALKARVRSKAVFERVQKAVGAR